MPDCFGKPTARPFPRPKAVPGMPTATTSCRGLATRATTACTAHVSMIARLRRLAVAVMRCIPAIAALMVARTIAGGIMFMLTNAAAAPCPIADLTSQAAAACAFCLTAVAAAGCAVTACAATGCAPMASVMAVRCMVANAASKVKITVTSQMLNPTNSRPLAASR